MGSFVPAVIRPIPFLSALVPFTSVVCHTSIFFGMAGYCSFHTGILKGMNRAVFIFIITITIALALLALHALSLPAVNILSVENKILVANAANISMFIFFIVALAYIAFIFFSLAISFKNLPAAFKYASLTGA
ncbi:MAG: hypothetical protein AAB221_08410, partial [Bacteroidota bacterium]